MTRTRSNRRTIITVPAPETTTPDQPPLTRADFDHAIAVLRRLSSFSQVRAQGALDEYADLRRSINRLELYRDWWAVPQDPNTTPAHSRTLAPDAAARIADLEEQVRSWRGYSRRNEERAKKAQRELDQIKTTRRQR